MILLNDFLLHEDKEINFYLYNFTVSVIFIIVTETVANHGHKPQSDPMNRLPLGVVELAHPVAQVFVAGGDGRPLETCFGSCGWSDRQTLEPVAVLCQPPHTPHK